MAVFNGTDWFKDNIKPYLALIKAELNSLGNVTGQYAGKGATFAGLPTTDAEGAALLGGDWSILTVDDVGTGSAEAPQYPAGVYAYNFGTSSWELVQESQDMADVLLAIFATSAEVTAGTATDKAMTVAQLFANFAKINGDSSQLFSVSAGNIDTNEAVNANQFSSTAITDAEACTHWNAVTAVPCV